MAILRKSSSMRRPRPPETAVGARSGVSRFGREAGNVGGVAFRPGVAGALHAAAGAGRRHPGDRRPPGDPGRSLRGSGPERSGDAGGPAAHRRATYGGMARPEKRSGRLEGCARSAPGRFDALPILAAAKEVTIAEIPEQDGRRADALSHVADVAAWLRGHGIAANTVVPEKAGGVTGQIENIAAHVGAGVVIAGAYGHSRFREWVLSGVTRHLATESRRCAFLSR